jgi:nucleotide-binding universal stress UspA family protein
MAAARADLQAEAARLSGRKGAVTIAVAEGHPDEVLAAQAAECHARVIVVASIGTRATARHRMGSVSERTAQGAPVPTLVIRDAAPFKAWLAGTRPLEVLAGFDFSIAAEGALAFVQFLRGLAPCDVTVGCVREMAAPEDRGPTNSAGTDGLEARLRAAVDGLLDGEGTAASLLVGRGPADFTLMDMAAAQRADVVVLGAHQQRGLAAWWTRSVSRSLLHHAAVSVATVPVRQTLARLPRVPAVRRVLAATDFSVLGNRAVAHALALAPAGSTVRVVHVVHPLALAGGAFESAPGESPRHLRHMQACERRLRTAVPAETRNGAVTTEVGIIEHESPAIGITEEAARMAADLIVMGTQGRTALGRVVLGSVAHAVLTESDRPVFLVKSPSH